MLRTNSGDGGKERGRLVQIMTLKPQESTTFLLRIVARNQSNSMKQLHTRFCGRQKAIQSYETTNSNFIPERYPRISGLLLCSADGKIPQLRSFSLRQLTDRTPEKQLMT
jgi:hypothetical protein